MASTVKEANSLRVAKGLGTHSHASFTLPEAASQTFKKGSPIVVSSGYAQEASDDSEVLYGIADEPGENGDSAGDKNVRVIPALPGYLFEGVLGSSSATEHALAATDIGAVYGFNKDSTNGGWYLDDQETAVGTVRARVVGLKDDIGTNAGRVFFTFLVFTNNEGTADATTVGTLLAYSAAA